MLKRILFFFALALMVSSVVSAQITTSAMAGSVKNASNEALAGATITATHLPSGTKYVTVTKAGGVFSIPNMRVGGPYLVEVTFVGYRTEKIEDLYLQLAETSQLLPVLTKSDAVLENVILATGRRNVILNAGRTGALTSISKREITVLPNINRGLGDLSRIAPQANGQAIGGGHARQNNVTIDGSDFNNTFGIASGGTIPAQGTPISIDAIEEFSVNITPFDVRQSGFIGSAINAVTRSGTNTLSGSVYRYWRNEKMQGFKVEKSQFVRQRLDFEQWGFRVGGPIIKNKLFYFINYETETSTTPGQSKIASATSASFGTANNIARPTIAELNAIRDYLRNTGPGKTWQYDPGEYDNYDVVGDKKKILARIDWNISNKHKASIRYSQVESKDPAFLNNSTTGSGAFFASGDSRNSINALHFSNSNFFQGYNFYSFAAELNSTFRPGVSNTLRATYNDQNEPRIANSTDFPTVDILKDGLAFTTFGYEPFTYGNIRRVKIYSVVDNLTIAVKKHNILIGAQFDFTKTVNGFQPYGASYYKYNSFADFQNGVIPTDFAQTFSLKKDYSQAFSAFKFNQISAFIQDEITLTRDFRLTVGLRADRSSYPGVEEIKENPLVSALTFAGGVRVNTGQLPKVRILFSPRIGFNWDMYGDRSLQIRGGTGIFTGRVPYVWIVGQSANSGMLQVNQTFNAANGIARPGPFNPVIGAYRPASPPQPGTTMTTGVTAFAPNFKMPQTWKTSLAMDVKLPWGIIGTVEAIYNRDFKMIYSKNVNLTNPSRLGVNAYPWDNRNIYPVTTNGANNVNRLSNPSPGILVPSPSGTIPFSMVLSANEKRGHYASLAIKLDKTLKKGFAASVAYTKTIANTLFDGIGDQPFNLWSLIATVDGANTPSLSHAGYTVPDRFVATLSYRKEYLKHLATTVSIIYQGSIDGRFSYVYGADFNRDGVNGNDLIWIPTREQVQQMLFTTRNVNGVAYNQDAQRALFESYIQQDKYLRTHRGQYAERNGAQLPWRNQMDVKILQDVFTNIGKNRNTIQFSLDIFNIGNLISPTWGKVKIINAASILVPQNQNSLVPGGAVVPTFQLNIAQNQMVTRTFRDDLSFRSTYYMQMGLRYIFNN